MHPMNEQTREPTETLGERLRRLRKEQGLSQQAISGPGLTTAHISRIEAGLRRPSVRAVRALAKKLGVTPEYLETGRTLGPRGDFEVRVVGAEIELRIGAQNEQTTSDLRALVEEARTIGDPLLTARALAAAGLTSRTMELDAEAVPLLEEAIASPVITPSLRPDVYIALAQAYSAVGRPTDAVDLLESALAFVEGHAEEHVGARVRLTVSLSQALADSGHLEGAEKLLEEAVRRHGESSDRRAQASRNWKLARIAISSGDSSTAIEHARRALVLLEAEEDGLAHARAFGLFGRLLILDGRFDEAREPLNRCVQALEREGAIEETGLYVADEAKCAANLGKLDKAERLAKRAVDLLSERPSDQGGALGALAIVRAGQNKAEEAESLFEQSVSLLERSGELEEASRVCRSWALLLRDLDRRDEADGLLNRSDDLGKRARSRTR